MNTKTLIYMKRIILLIALCHIQPCISAQDIDSLIDIKGYYVTVFSKQEIVFSYEQKIKKEKGECYSIPIDFTIMSFFIPIQIGNKIICEKDTIIGGFLNPTQTDSLYVIPHVHYDDLLKKINAVTTDISKGTCILSESMHLSPYYEINGNDTSLFKCTYIEGYAQHKNIQDIEYKWRTYLLLNLLYYGKKTENIEFFFIVKIDNYTPYIEISELKKWLPYLK